MSKLVVLLFVFTIAGCQNTALNSSNKPVPLSVKDTNKKEKSHSVMNNESKGEAHIRKRSNLTTDTKSKSISLVVKDVNKNKEKPYSVLNNDSKVVGKIQKNSNTTLVKKVVKSKSIVENDISKKRVVKNSIKIIASPGESLKDTLAKTLSKSKYKLIWNSGYDVIFENYTEYKGDNAIDVVKKIASDIQSMGLDIHFNVYVKNNIILVFSVRN